MPAARVVVDLNFYPELQGLLPRQRVKLDLEAEVEFDENGTMMLKFSSININEIEKLSTQERMVRSLEKISNQTSEAQPVP